MTIASDLFRTVTVKIHDISQQLPYIVVNQADDNGKIIRFVPLDHGQKVTGFTGARLYYPPRSDNEYGDYVTGVESDGAWDFTIPVGVLSAGRVGCNLAFIDGDGETYSRNVVFLVEPAVSGVFDPEDGQQTRLNKIIGTVQNAADTAIDSINDTVDNAVERVNKTASDAVESIGKAEESINESVTDARESAEAAASSATAGAQSASKAQDAVDGFGLQVGTTTTGNPGTNAAVEIRKTGTKYTANFTIPRGDKGDVPSLSRTMAVPESKRWNAIDFNDFTENGVYTFNGYPTNSPRGDSTWITGTLIVSHSFQSIMQLCAYSPSTTIAGFAFRNGKYSDASTVTQWYKWHQIAFLDDLPKTSTLANETGDIASLSTRMQALEARIKSLETNQ